MSSFYTSTDFWFAVSFALLALLTFKPVMKAIISALDDRSAKIRAKIEEMSQLIKEADLTLAEFKTKYESIDQELVKIAENTDREIALLRSNSDREIAGYIKQRSHQTYEKIASEEKKTLELLRSESVILASMVSAEIIKESMTLQLTETQIEKSLKIIKEKI